MDGWWSVPLFAILLFGIINDRYWRFFSQWRDGRRSRNWPVIPAAIDLVTVFRQTEKTEDGEVLVGYLVTLTYFYRNPELQVGEYYRMFPEERGAQAWAASYKGKTVNVRVDPRDPISSVLRKEEL